MNDIKVTKYFEQPYGEYQLGFCTVEMGGKCGFVLKVVKAKSGTVFCAFTSTKLGESWHPIFKFIDSEYEKRFLEECRTQLMPLMAPPAPSVHQQEQFFVEIQDTDVVPF